MPGTILRLPSSVSIRPARHFSRVVLPAPLRPISASRSRGPMKIEIAEEPAFALDQAEVFIGQNWGCHRARPSLASGVVTGAKAA